MKYTTVLILFIVSVTGSTRSQEKKLLGFTENSTTRQIILEKQIIGMPSSQRMDVYHQAMTAKPHHAGTRANVETAEYYADRLREFGFDEVIMNHYEVLLPRPIEREITLVAPEIYRLKLFEPPIPEDPDSDQEGILPTFNAYSADGDVTAEVVYVNYGIPEDYEVLDSMGISVKGKIVIARYLRSWRGIKPRLAGERGAIGCLIYSDPADDGFVKGDVIPKGKWRPEHGVQRGSVMDMPHYPGDPQTPMRPSKKGAKRIPLDEVTTFQKIPVQPISYGDALPILRSLGGEVVPGSWQGGLPIAYHFGPGPAKVHMKLKFDWSIRPIVNVIGILRGSEEPRKIVMTGGHRDAWALGGRDPISGAVSLLESARVIGELARQNQRPKRSIAFASWDAEEYGLIGSTEYGEEFGDDLQGNMIVYLNRESYTAGNFSAGGGHALQPFINEVTQAVQMPGHEGTVFQSWLKKSRDNNIIDFKDDKNVRISALGSGSDYTVFLDHLGIPSMNIGFSAGNGIYHSRYDSRWFFTTFGDPGFKYGEKLSEIVAVFLMRMAQADILPFDYTAIAETIDRYLDEIQAEIEKRDFSEKISLSDIREANKQLNAAATVLNGEIDRILHMDENRLRRHRKSMQKLNDRLLAAEAAFLHSDGLPGRPWFRHQIYAPGYYTGYGVKTLPGVREAVEKNDIEEANEMAIVLEQVIRASHGVLVDAIVIAAGTIQ